MIDDFMEWDILDHKFCLWDRDLRSGRVGLSPNFLEHLGLRFDESLEHERFISLIHPEDLPLVSLHMGAHLAGKESQEKFTFRLRSQHSSYISFDSKGMIVVHSEIGSPMHLYWACERSVEKK